jgi:hypothetical protein
MDNETYLEPGLALRTYSKEDSLPQHSSRLPWQRTPPREKR